MLDSRCSGPTRAPHMVGIDHMEPSQHSAVLGLLIVPDGAFNSRRFSVVLRRVSQSPLVARRLGRRYSAAGCAGLLAAGMLVFGGAAEAAAQPTCFGLPATIEAQPGVPTTGTAGDDVIVGTAGLDSIDGVGEMTGSAGSTGTTFSSVASVTTTSTAATGLTPSQATSSHRPATPPGVETTTSTAAAVSETSWSATVVPRTATLLAVEPTNSSAVTTMTI